MLWFSRRERWRIPAALWQGGAITLGLMGTLGAIMLVSWNEFFVGFHRIFFQDGTWTFAYSDTLIRLFPLRFWIDASVGIVILLGLTAVVCLVAGSLWLRRRRGSDVNAPAREPDGGSG
jgi:integral membrane protein (TIGR01906 family)